MCNRIKCPHISNIQKYSLKPGVKLNFDDQGKVYYYINNFTKDLDVNVQLEQIISAFDRWNYHLSKYKLMFERSFIKERAYVQILFVGGDSGTLPEPRYLDQMEDENMIAFAVMGTGLIYINDNTDWSKFSIRFSLEHELGHTQGILHSKNPSSFMYDYYDVDNSFTADDFEAMDDLYSPGSINVRKYLSFELFMVIFVLVYIALKFFEL